MLKIVIVALGVFIISFFSVTSGGVGLLTRPLLIALGYPPALAIGSFRAANLFARMGSLSAFAGRRIPMTVDWRLAFQLFFPSFLAGIIGAELVAYLNGEVLKKMLGVFIILMSVVLLFKRRLGFIEVDGVLTPRKRTLGIVLTVIIGIIASFLGGSGILFAYLMIFVYHKNYLSSVPVRKIANFGSALSSAILFIFQGIVSWPLVITVLIAGITGEYFGTRCQMHRGEKWIERVAQVIVVIVGLMLLFV